MAFHFPLEAVLRLRLSQERRERLRLDIIVSEILHTRAQLTQISETSLQSRREFQEQLGDTLTGAEIQFASGRIEAIQAARISLQARLAELDERRAAQIKMYLKARQHREIIENLRQRKLDLYRIEQTRREQQELDDIYLMRLEVPTDE
jgi:flagellar export protein FliJ